MSDTNVIAEGDLVIELTQPAVDESSSEVGMQAGGEGGAAVINDVTLTFERETTMHHGIGNDEPVDHSSGNKTYSLDEEADLSRVVYETLREMYRQDIPAEGVIIDDGEEIVVDVNIGKIVWNTIEMAASDGDDVTVNLQADCYDVDW